MYRNAKKNVVSVCEYIFFFSFRLFFKIILFYNIFTADLINSYKTNCGTYTF